MKFPFLLATLLAATLQSRAGESAQPLTDRLKTFYDCYTTGHFRQADALVASDSKDLYFDAAKERFRSYTISRIDLKDNGNTAEVMLVVDTDFQFGGKATPIKMPVLAHWKKIDGAWYWYAPVREVSPLPFGEAQSRQAQSQAQSRQQAAQTFDRNASPALRPFQPSPVQPALTALLDKPVLTLSPGKQNGDIAHLRNTSKFPIDFHIEFDEIAGVSLTPLKGSANPGESVAIQASLSNSAALRQANTKQAGYIVIHSGIRLQFYVSLESAAIRSSQYRP